MKSFVQVIRDIETAMGLPRRVLHGAELERRKSIRRSAYLAAPGRSGQTLDSLSIEFRRPGYGIAPDLFESVASRKLRADLPTGHCLSLADLD
jgi:sialic acid synthase SpsE